jgi:hypothetical protein
MFRVQTETTSMLLRAVYSVFSWTQGHRPFKYAHGTIISKEGLAFLLSLKPAPSSSPCLLM